MRILFLISTITGGGAAHVLTCLANQFAESGDDVGFITSYIETEKGEYPLDERITRFCLSDKRTGVLEKNFVWPRKIDKLCREFKPDAVLSFLPEPNIRLLLGTSRKDFVRVVSVRSDPKREYSSKLYAFLAKRLYPKADGVVFQTEDARRWFGDKVAKNSVILYNQVDDKFFNLIHTGERRHIIATGRMTAAKNHKSLIEAFSRIADKIDDDLYIYGDGALFEQTQALVNELGLENRIHLPGSVNDVADKIKGARVYVLSSIFEGMPNALLEALAMGVPCISTDCPCGGPHTVIEDGVNGILIPINDTDALAEKLIYAYENPDVMEQMGKNARERSDCFRSDRVYAEWRGFIEKLIENKKK